MKSVVVWFEIPAADVDRCQKFYETIMDVQMHREEVNGHKMAFFPHQDEAIGGAIIEQEEGQHPGTQGPLVYLNGGSDLSVALNKVEAAGGKITMPRTLINENIGYMATFLDTEGNRLALYEPVKH